MQFTPTHLQQIYPVQTLHSHHYYIIHILTITDTTHIQCIIVCVCVCLYGICLSQQKAVFLRCIVVMSIFTHLLVYMYNICDLAFYGCLHMCCASIYLSYSSNYCFILFFINTSIKHRQFKGSSSSRGTDTMTDGPSFPMNPLTQTRGYDSCTRSILVNHELQVNVSEHDYASIESCIFWL